MSLTGKTIGQLPTLTSPLDSNALFVTEYGGTTYSLPYWQNYGVVTGFSFNIVNYDLTLTGDKGLTLTQSLAILSSDMTIVSGSYNPTNGVATFINNSGGTFNVTGFLTGYTDFVVSGLTYDNLTGTLTLTQTNGSTITASGFTGIYITGGTYSNGSLTLVNNFGTPLTITGFTTVSAFTYNNANRLTIVQVDGTQLSVTLNTVTGLTSTGDINVNSNIIGKGPGSGTDNVVVGKTAFLVNTTGSNNVGVGVNSLRSNSTGGSNVGVGSSASRLNATGNQNTAVGYFSLYNNTNSNNTALGYNSLQLNTSGANNTAVGSGALTTNTLGSSNTVLGYNADVTSNNLTNATAIGANAKVSSSNSLILGNNANVGIGTSNPTHRLTVSGRTANILRVIGSGTTGSIFTVQGSQGELFTVNDSLIGSLFSVNDISGLPIFNVFSDQTILMGGFLAPSLNTTVRKTVLTGSTVIYSIPVSAYTGAFFDYTATNGTNVKAGSIISGWNTTSANFTENSTSIGVTSAITFSVSVSSGLASLRSSATTNNWVVKTIVRSI